MECMGPHDTVKILIYVFLLNFYKRNVLFSSCFYAFIFTSSFSVFGHHRCIWLERPMRRVERDYKINYYCQAFWGSIVATLHTTVNDRAGVYTKLQVKLGVMSERRPWLPINQRVIYKLSVLTYKELHTGQPCCLADLLHLYRPSRALRSTNSHLLAVPCCWFASAQL